MLYPLIFSLLYALNGFSLSGFSPKWFGLDGTPFGLYSRVRAEGNAFPPNLPSAQTRRLSRLEQTHLEQTRLGAVLAHPEFQDFVETLKAPLSSAQVPLAQTSRVEEADVRHSLPHESGKSLFPSTVSGELYIFVSFSMGEAALLHLARDAKRYGATLVLKGFVESNYLKTLKALQKIITETEQGFTIDPELFTLFAVTAAPTFILSQSFRLGESALQETQSQEVPPREAWSRETLFTPRHDRLQGHVSVFHALETFAQEGDLQEEAKALLFKGGKK